LRCPLCFELDGCGSVLPLPAPAKESHCAEASGEEWDRHTSAGKAFAHYISKVIYQNTCFASIELEVHKRKVKSDAALRIEYRPACANGSEILVKLSARLCQIVLPLIAALLLGVNVASAYTYSSYTVSGEQEIWITSPTDVFAEMGQIDLIGTGASQGINILAWCLDVYDPLLGNGNGGSGPFTYNITLPQPPTLSVKQILEIGGLMANGNANIGTANVSAATQLAIWEVEYGSAFRFAGVSWQTSNLATTLINDLGSSIPLNANIELFTDEGNQTLGTLITPFITPTPLPAALPLFATGIGVMGLLGWRRKKRKAIASIRYPN
jgi:hypothetical protein